MILLGPEKRQIFEGHLDPRVVVGRPGQRYETEKRYSSYRNEAFTCFGYIDKIEDVPELANSLKVTVVHARGTERVIRTQNILKVSNLNTTLLLVIQCAIHIKLHELVS